MTPEGREALTYHSALGPQHSDDVEALTAAVRKLALLSEDEDGWLRLPWAPLEPVQAALAGLPAACDTLLVIGIGGSSVGLRALHEALEHQVRPNGRRIVFLETIEADRLGWILGGLEPDKTAVHVVTKSGQTLETIANFLCVESWLRNALQGGAEVQSVDPLAGRVLVTTDPSAGPLVQHARACGYREVSLPSPVGGRYSVLSAVGLVGLVWMGADVEGLLAGARSAATRCLEPAPASNPALALARDQVGHYREGRTQTVFMPYGGQLEGFSRWFVQLWAESLGKSAIVGPTPLAAVGTQDQHAQLQLIVEGPPVRNLLFVEATAPLENRSVPAVPPSLSALGYLEGQSLHALRAASLEGVRRSLSSVGVPHATLTLPRFDAAGLGALLLTIEAATALAGFLLGVDPFNQPGVEGAKHQTRAMLLDASSAKP